MSKQKKEAITLRFEIEKLQTIDEITSVTGGTRQSLFNNLIDALISHWDKRKKITLPLEITDDSHEYEVTAAGAKGKIARK